MSLDTFNNNIDDQNSIDNELNQVTENVGWNLDSLRKSITLYSNNELINHEFEEYEKQILEITDEDKDYLGVSPQEYESLKNKAKEKTLTDSEKIRLSEIEIKIKKLKFMKRAIQILLQSQRDGDIDIQTKENYMNNPFHLDGDEIEVHTDNNWYDILRAWYDIEYLSDDMLSKKEEWNEEDVNAMNKMYQNRIENIKDLLYNKAVEDLFLKINNKQRKIEKWYENNPFYLDWDDIEVNVKGLDEEVLDDDIVFWSGYWNKRTQDDVDSLNTVYQNKLESFKRDSYKEMVEKVVKEVRVDVNDIDKAKKWKAPFEMTHGFGVTFFNKEIDDLLPINTTFSQEDIDELNKIYNTMKNDVLTNSLEWIIDRIQKNDIKLEEKDNQLEWPFFLDIDGDIMLQKQWRDENIFQIAYERWVDLDWAGDYSWGSLPFVRYKEDVKKLNDWYKEKFLDNTESLKEKFKQQTLDNLVRDALDSNKIKLERRHLSDPFYLEENSNEIKIHDKGFDKDYLSNGLEWNNNDIRDLNQKYEEKLKEKMEQEKPQMIDNAVTDLVDKVLNESTIIKVDNILKPFVLDTDDHNIKIKIEKSLDNFLDNNTLFENNMIWNEEDLYKLNELYSKKYREQLNQSKEVMINKKVKQLIQDVRSGSIEIEEEHKDKPFYIENYTLKVHGKFDMWKASKVMKWLWAENIGWDQTYGTSNFYWKEWIDDVLLNRRYNREK